MKIVQLRYNGTDLLKIEIEDNVYEYLLEPDKIDVYDIKSLLRDILRNLSPVLFVFKGKKEKIFIRTRHSRIIYTQLGA